MKGDPNKPFKVIVFGEAGVGKSGECKNLVPQYRYQLLSITD